MKNLFKMNYANDKDMTVKELIEILKQVDGDLTLCFSGDEYALSVDSIDVIENKYVTISME